MLGGSFRLSFHGQTTASIPHDASAAVVQAALEDLSEIGGVTVVRYVGPSTKTEWRINKQVRNKRPPLRGTAAA